MGKMLAQDKTKRLVCDYCGAKLKWGTKAKHFRSEHPEFVFTTPKKLKGPGHRLRCQCGSYVNNFKNLVRSHLHTTSINGPAGVVSAPKRELEPLDVLDQFFDSIGAMMDELKKLRAEKQEWQQKAEKWSNRVVELQDLMSRGERH